MKLFLVFVVVVLTNSVFHYAKADSSEDVFELTYQFLKNNVTRDFGKLVDATAQVSSACARHNFNPKKTTLESMDYHDITKQMHSCRLDKLQVQETKEPIFEIFGLIEFVVDFYVIMASADVESLAKLTPVYMRQGFSIELSRMYSLYQHYADCAAESIPTLLMPIPATEFWESLNDCFLSVVVATPSAGNEYVKTRVILPESIIEDIDFVWGKQKSS